MEDIKTIIKILSDFPKASEQEIETILNARKRIAPRLIEELDYDEIFVFGGDTNKSGGSGAAKTANEKFNAVLTITGWKEDDPEYRAYCIPTTKNKKNLENAKKEIIKDVLIPAIVEFQECVEKHKELKFYLTRIGCGRAGGKDEEIAPLFKDLLKYENVYFPQSWIDVLFHEENSIINPSALVPSTSNNPDDFRQVLEQKLSKYITWLRKNTKSLKLIEDVEVVCNAIVLAIDMMYRGLPAEAYKCIKNMFDGKTSNGESMGKKAIKELVSEFPNFVPVTTEDFYRIRPEKDNHIKKTVDRGGMFHIPLDMRGVIRNQRYSVPGYPCLYLGETVFTCWEEMSRPNLSDCLISRLHKENDFMVLDLTIPDGDSWNIQNKNSLHQIVMFPFVIASTFRASNPDASFKPEYIIPQLILQYVKDKSFEKNRKEERENRKVYGIKYTSVNMPREGEYDHFGFNKDRYINYVIPVLNISGRYCSKLNKLFTITNPYCEEFEVMSKNLSKNLKKDKDNYSVSKFGLIESILENDMRFELKHIE